MSNTPEENKWVETLMEHVDETSKEDMRCIICNEGTRERGIFLTPGVPTIPMIFGVCPVCKMLPGWKEEIKQLIWSAISEESESEEYG